MNAKSLLTLLHDIRPGVAADAELWHDARPEAREGYREEGYHKSPALLCRINRAINDLERAATTTSGRDF